MTLDETLTTKGLTSTFTREEAGETIMYVARVNEVKLHGNDLYASVSGKVVLECHRKRKNNTLLQQLVNYFFGEYEPQWTSPTSDGGCSYTFLSIVEPEAYSSTRIMNIKHPVVSPFYTAADINAYFFWGKRLDPAQFRSAFSPVFEQLNKQVVKLVTDFYQKKGLMVYERKNEV